jgi:transcriptional regulator with XRE-family HTH domain
LYNENKTPIVMAMFFYKGSSVKQKRAQIIGRRLKMLRQYHNLSQQQLAEKMNCTQQFISHYEKGLHCMSVDMLLDFCDVLDVDLNYFDPRNEIVMCAEKKVQYSQPQDKPQGK